MLLLLSKACALDEHWQKETNLEMLVENARFQRNAQSFLGFFDFATCLLVFPRVFWLSVSYLVLPRAFLSYLVLPWAIWFCRALFDFAVSYLVLSLAFWFSRELFGFALSFLVFPWAIGFFPWAIWFRRDLFGFTITFVGHRNGPLVIMGHVTFFFFY